MKKYTLDNKEIEDRYREIHIYPKCFSSNEYLIHWDSFEAGTIQKSGGKWFTNSVDLLSVANEIGAFIDSSGGFS